MALADRSTMPTAIRRESDAVVISWIEPGHAGYYPARELRLACPCAVCVDEMTGRPLLDPAMVPMDVTVDALELVGGYGIRVRWSGGHSAGIYTFEWLRRHCPCGQCGGEGLGRTGPRG
ncbi:MAG TPA: DUF971 domain-containing protein [Gemmatimonadales bacterium]|nr:DUF971 domain-containing protein [Gemmatimonadales bacterium]